MKIAVVGNAKLEYGDFAVDFVKAPFSAEHLLDYDVVLDFSSSYDVVDNIIMYCHLGLCAVIASSEWLEHKDFILSICSEDEISIAYGDFRSLTSDLISLAGKFYLKKQKLLFERL